MSWIGKHGYLHKLKCPASMPISKGLPVTVQTTLGGVDKAQVPPAPVREWSLDMSAASPPDVHVLDSLDYGLFGEPPFLFIDPWAESTNVLTPAASQPGDRYRAGWSGDAVGAGAVTVPFVGRVHHALLTNGVELHLAAGTPVVPGLPVTGSVHLSGLETASFGVRILDVDGSELSYTETSQALSNTYQRVHVTVESAPAGAASCELVVTGAMGAALPAVTWTRHLAPWVPGQGASAVMVESHTVDPVRAVKGGAMLASQSARVIELRGATR